MSDYRIPGSLLNIIFKSVEDQLGERGLKMLLTQTKLADYIQNPPPDDDTPTLDMDRFKSAMGAVIDLFGEKAARPLLTRWGKLTFDYALESNPTLFGLAGFATKFMNDEGKARFILKRVLKESENLYGVPHVLTETPDAFNIEIQNCFYCGNHKSNQCICWPPVGFWKSMMRWATGKDYDVHETECIAMGAESCKYVIPKKAMT